MQGIKEKVTVSLLVADMEATLGFYEALGFAVSARQVSEGAGRRAEVRRGAAALQFFDKPPVGISSTPQLSGTIYFYPESVTALAREWRGKVNFEWGPEEMPYGMREFGIKDPNGYYLAFAEPV